MVKCFVSYLHNNYLLSNSIFYYVKPEYLLYDISRVKKTKRFEHFLLNLPLLNYLQLSSILNQTKNIFTE